MNAEPTLEDRVTRLEQLLERAIEYGSKSPIGRVMLAKLGLSSE